MSHTALKIGAAAIAIAAVPAAFIYQENERLRVEVSASIHRSSADAHVSAHGASSTPATDLAGLNREAAAVWNQIAAEQSRRKQAEEKVAALNTQIEQAQTEVVVSFGQVEETARKLVEFARAMQEVEHLKKGAGTAGAGQVTKAQIEKVTASFPEIMAMNPQISKIESDPALAGRFYATMVGEQAGIDSAQREAIAKVVAQRFVDMRQLGVTDDRRPTSADSAWIASRQRALKNLQDTILAALPENKRDGKSSISELMDLATGEWLSNGADSESGK